MATLTGSVDHVVFRNEENGFCVARFLESSDDRDGQTTIVGVMPALVEGERLRLEGEWEVHPKHGRNFRVERFEGELPETTEAIERFLASGAIKGIGPATASRIVAKFGEETIRILDDEPEQLMSVAGITLRRQRTIRKSWQEQKRVRELAMFLQAHGINVGLSRRIYATYGERAVAVIEEDPYRLAREVDGIGFRTADQVALKVGVTRDSLSRYVAGLRHVLEEGSDQGHVFLRQAELLDRAAEMLPARRENLEVALLELLRHGDAVVEDDAVYLTAFHRAETCTTELLQRLHSTPSFRPGTQSDIAAQVEAAASEQGLELEAKQLQAAEQALREKVSVLTGGPGTGKTSTLRTVITALEQANISYCLCAPTGRAAKRVTEATGRPASTIHRLLGFQPNTREFSRDEDDPLEEDFVVVDEVSMLDTLLFYHLLKAIRPEAHLLLVGDADQLPSVGAGNVLGDLLASGLIPTVRLTELFRQALGSRIVLAAHAVNRGEMPDIESRPDSDFFFVEAESERDALMAIKRLVGDRIPTVFGLDPIDDIQVLSPMHRGLVGVSNLNSELQALLNPLTAALSASAKTSVELSRGQRSYRRGDKVMQIKNNYDKEVYNGDVGKITEIDTKQQLLSVGFSNGFEIVDVEYAGVDLDELVPAYAASVHKAQGSEFPCVVMPLVTSHSVMLQTNLLYTAITRARLLCVLVGSKRALEMAVSSRRKTKRNTGLASSLARMNFISSQLA